MAPKTPMSKRPAGLQRLSPGVYRNQQGQLTNNAGRPMNGGARPQAMPGAQAGQLAQQPPPGGFASGMGAGLGVALDSRASQGMQGQLAPMQEGYERQGFGMGAGIGKGPAYVPVQQYPGLGGFGQGAGIVREGMGGQWNGMQEAPFGPPSQELMNQARSRAEAIRGGGMVTMDYNPQREALVEEYLGQMGGRPQPPTWGGQGFNGGFGSGAPDYAAQLAQAMAYEQQRVPANPGMQSSFQGAIQGAGQGFGMGNGPAPMPRPNGPMTRPPAPMRPQGDGRDRRFPGQQIATRPPAPLPRNTPQGPIPQPRQVQKGVPALLRRGR